MFKGNRNVKFENEFELFAFAFFFYFFIFFIVLFNVVKFYDYLFTWSAKKRMREEMKGI